jgi:hypothetical protein
LRQQLRDTVAATASIPRGSHRTQSSATTTNKRDCNRAKDTRCSSAHRSEQVAQLQHHLTLVARVRGQCLPPTARAQQRPAFHVDTLVSPQLRQCRLRVSHEHFVKAAHIASLHAHTCTSVQAVVRTTILVRVLVQFDIVSAPAEALHPPVPAMITSIQQQPAACDSHTPQCARSALRDVL